ncbi:CrcB family protein [Phycicoccus sp. BSK3Z-2]|uniref:Fluoride-specific ion channel FluC n=1 Tax=Phycicoccus avicenniae TaxID=2828860 RepID=A0A941HYB8_9MICO|nr:CrcB family protein [Phycicoccus avicenniae]MBR7741725.1 CrcB family protein [Phycicoccus avicenniae]
MTAADALLVAVGAAVGAPARMLVGHWVRQRFAVGAPVGTLVVNVAGSFVLGLLVGGGAGHGWLAVGGTGFCGAFTTFSSLALEVREVAEDDGRRAAAGLVAGSLVLGLGAAAAGWVLGR